MPNDKPTTPINEHNRVAGLQILGSPKTVNLVGRLKGNILAGPLEVWVAAIVASMPDDQKARFAAHFEAQMRTHEANKDRVARVVADIPMPGLLRQP